MEMKIRKSARLQQKIEALRTKMSRADGDLAADILTLIVTGRYFDFDDLKEKHPLALEYAYLHVRNEFNT